MFWGIVPAAGQGRRIGGSQPKQYLQLAGKSLLEHSLSALILHPEISGVVVALPAGGELPASLKGKFPGQLFATVGGAERADSVLAALNWLDRHLRGKPATSTPQYHELEVLVHDAARPCLSQDELTRLLACDHQGQGAILARPCPDTVKSTTANADVQKIIETLDRNSLKLAQTPQRFSVALLKAALESAKTKGIPVTDEASAMEAAGYQPFLVEGLATNLKVTYPEDLLIAEAILKHQQNGDSQ